MTLQVGLKVLQGWGVCLSHRLTLGSGERGMQGTTFKEALCHPEMTGANCRVCI